jgi:thioredoxin-related protein
MNVRHHWIPLVSFLLLLFFSIGNVQADNQPNKRGTITGGIEHSMPDWFKESFLDIQSDVEEASGNKKHVMLFFHLNECPYCDKMLKESFSKPPLKDFIQAHFDVIAINTKGDREVAFSKDQSFTEKALSQQLKVQYTPTILFLDSNNNAVARLNGYRSLTKFKHILNYVNDAAYKNTTLEAYLEQHVAKSVYTLRDNPLFKPLSDFSAIKTPLAVIFEDTGCDECANLHDKLLNRTDVQDELKAFTVARLDAASTTVIKDNEGNKTTAKAWAEKLGLTYRPGIILFDQGKEVTRIDGLLFSFHFKEVFRYVSGNYYTQFKTYNDYLAKRQNELLDKGINIDIAE